MAAAGRSSAVSIADLLEAVSRLAGDSADARLRIARVLGFELKGGAVPALRTETPVAPPEPALSVPPPAPKNIPSEEDALQNARLLEPAGAVDPWQRWAKDVEGVEPLEAESPLLWHPPEPAPLLPPAQLREIVIQLGATDCGRGAIDLRRLLRSLAKGEPVRAVPHLKRRSLRRGVQLIVDIGEGMLPFFHDAVLVREAFQRYIGAAHVTVLEVDGSPDRVCDPAGNAPDYRPPPRGVPVVVMGDLGAGRDFRAPGKFSRAWQELARYLSAQHTRLCALVPAYSHLAGVDAPAGVTLVPWRPETTAGVVRRAIRSRCAQLPAGSLPDSDAARRLKPLLAPAVRVEPGLLRQMRQLLPAAGVGAEAAVWFDDQVMDASPAGFRFVPDKKEDLLRQLKGESEFLRREARERMSGQHEGMPPVLRREEESVWELVEHGPEYAALQLRPILAAMAQDKRRRSALIRWLSDAQAHRLPRALRNAEGLEWVRVARFLGAGRSASDETGCRRVGIRITPSLLELGGRTPPVLEAILVAKDSPSLYVQIGDGGARRYVCDPGVPHEIRLDEPGAVTVWNALGTVYRLERPKPPPAELRTFKVMISSTRADLMPYRERTRQVLEKLRREMKEKLSIIEVSMEEVQTGDPEPPIERSLEWVRKSDCVVLIVGWHYGTISSEPGNDGRSVTEREFDYAIELKKKVLVFMAGEPNTPNAYHGRADSANLVLWTMMQDDAQQKRMRDFRTKLDSSHTAYFEDIDDFADQLERTFGLHSGPLASFKNSSTFDELALRLLNSSIRPCYQRLNTLHRSKVIHDTVHRIRQHILIPIRDGLLPRWAASGELSREDERALARLLGELQGLRTRLDHEAAKLVRSEVEDFCRRLDGLSNKLRSLQISPADQPDGLIALDDFTEILNVSMSALEKAFRAANAEMLRQKDVFADLHISMMRELNKEKHAAHLPPDERKTLTDEIEKITINRRWLVAAMDEHAKWQGVHEELVMLGEAADSRRKQLKQELIEDRGPLLLELTLAIRAQDDKDQEVDARLNDQFDKLLAAFKALQAQKDDVTWALFCRDFDQSFFMVDQWMLMRIEQARRYLASMEDMLIEHAPLDPLN